MCDSPGRVNVLTRGARHQSFVGANGILNKTQKEVTTTVATLLETGFLREKMSRMFHAPPLKSEGPRRSAQQLDLGCV